MMCAWLRFVCRLLIYSLPVHSVSQCVTYSQSLPISPYGHQVVHVHAKNAVYLFGGRRAIGSSIYYTTVYKWDLSVSNSWFQAIVGSTPTDPFWTETNSAVVIGDIIFFVGMRDSTSSSALITALDIIRFNTSTETWSTLSATASTPPARSSGCLSHNNTHIFLVDGYDASTTSHDAMLNIYDVAADEWTASIAVGRSTENGWRSQFCSLVDDTLYIFGGKIRSNSYTVNSVVYAVDLPTLQISTAFPTMSRAFGTALHHQRLIYLVGGENHPSFYDDILAFDIVEQSFSSVFTLPIPVGTPAVAILDDKLYVFGGLSRTSDSGTNAVYMCDLPISTSTNVPTTLPSSFPSSPPTKHPSSSPSNNPTSSPINPPTISPVSDNPTSSPTDKPTISPSETPTAPPSNPSPPAMTVRVVFQHDLNDTNSSIVLVRKISQILTDQINNITMANNSECASVADSLYTNRTLIILYTLCTNLHETQNAKLTAYILTDLEKDILEKVESDDPNARIVAINIVTELDKDAIYEPVASTTSTTDTAKADDEEEVGIIDIVSNDTTVLIVLCSIAGFLLCCVASLVIACCAKKKQIDAEFAGNADLMKKPISSFSPASMEMASSPAWFLRDEDEAEDVIADVRDTPAGFDRNWKANNQSTPEHTMTANPLSSVPNPQVEGVCAWDADKFTATVHVVDPSNDPEIFDDDDAHCTTSTRY